MKHRATIDLEFTTGEGRSPVLHQRADVTQGDAGFDSGNRTGGGG